jgi:hypothetical protein
MDLINSIDTIDTIDQASSISPVSSIHIMDLMDSMEYISDQQKDIINSSSKYKLINGCTGSNKTDTLIKCAVRDLMVNKRPILFLTLVGSVTDEIKTRLEKRLGIDIYKQGASNHYIGFYNDVQICISNYDAWVHIMLYNSLNVSNNATDIDDIAGFYNEKVNMLLENTQREMKCYMKNDIKVGLLIVDEAQDLCSSKMKIITNISLTNTDMDIYIAGDYLQTLYTDENDASNMDAHSMNIFKRINPSYYDLSICMRCPKAHVDLNNLLLADIQSKYMIPPHIIII